MYLVLCGCSPDAIEPISRLVSERGLASCSTVIKGVHRFSSLPEVPAVENACLLTLFCAVDKFGELVKVLEEEVPGGPGALVALAVSGGNREFLRLIENGADLSDPG